MPLLGSIGYTIFWTDEVERPAGQVFVCFPARFSSEKAVSDTLALLGEHFGQPKWFSESVPFSTREDLQNNGAVIRLVLPYIAAYEINLETVMPVLLYSDEPFDGQQPVDGARYYAFVTFLKINSKEPGNQS